MFFDPTLTLDLRNLLPWAGDLFILITNLGSEIFYIGILLILFWSVHKREAIMVAFVLLFSAASNYLLKVSIMNPRPDPSTYLYPGIDPESNYSTPSAHAQNSATMYSWFTLKLKTWWMLLISIILTLLIGISRVYLGYHYFEDILLGWGIGVVSAIMLFYFHEPLAERLSSIKEDYLYMCLFLIGFLMTGFLSLVTPAPPLNDNFGSYGGMIMGLALSLPLEKKYIGFDLEPHNGQKWRLVVRVIIGLLIVVALLVGLKALIPIDDVWVRAARYIVVVLSGIVVWPFLFKKAKL